MNIRYILTILTTFVLFAACGGGEVPQPKPKAYLRVDMPTPDYIVVDTVRTPDSLGGVSFPAPFIFEKNRHAIFSQAKYSKRGAAIEIYYPQWSGYVELMYKPIAGRNDLQSQIDTAMRMLEYHYRVAAGIDEDLIQVPDNHVYATVWHINGRDVASTCQFVVTDSNAHFLHGEVIIDQSPNNDSLAPMLNYMQADVDHLVKTLRWK
jgi:gliding motility-associated lipoprotein GldD